MDDMDASRPPEARTTFAKLFLRACVLALCSGMPSAVSAQEFMAELARQARESGVDTYFSAPQDGAIYPANLPPPLFIWDRFTGVLRLFRDSRYEPGESWRLEVFESEKRLYVEDVKGSRQWRPPRELWHAWAGKSLTVKLGGKIGSSPHRALPLRVAIDHHGLPDDIFLRYLEVSEQGGKPAMSVHLLWLDPVREKRERLLSMNPRTTCIGCHSTAIGSGALWGILNLTGSRKAPRYRQIFEWRLSDNGSGWRERRSSRLPYSEYPRYSPAKDRVVCSIHFSSGPLQSIHIGFVGNFEMSETFDYRPYDTSTGLAIYDIKTDSLTALPGAASPDYVENMPSWSPDGETIAFVRYGTGQHKMDIYTVPYNQGRGGIAEPLLGASRNNSDNYFPEFSPDGRWIAFTRGDASRGWVVRDSSDIYLVPAGGGAARRLEFNAEGRMDSWHSWSSDGRWLLYSSKRDGITTKPFVARIYEDGRASAPIEIPTGLGPGQRVNLPTWVRKGRLPPMPQKMLDPRPGGPTSKKE